MMYSGTGMGAWGRAQSGRWVRYARHSAQIHAPGGRHVTPRHVLADRVGRGEIDEDEYLRRLRVLNGSSTAKGPGG